MPNLTLVIGNKNYSSWSLRPWLVLKHFDIEFTEVRIPLDQPETKAQILQYSPSGMVPALIDEDLILWESIAICEYLVEQFPDRPLWSADPTARAIARAVSAEMHAGFLPLRRHMSMDMRSRYPGKGREPGVMENIERITMLWKECRTRFGTGGDFLFGEFSIADAMYAPVVSRFVTYGVELDAIAQSYADAIWNLPAMQEWIQAAEAETEVLVDH